MDRLGFQYNVHLPCMSQAPPRASSHLIVSTTPYDRVTYYHPQKADAQRG